MNICRGYAVMKSKLNAAPTIHILLCHNIKNNARAYPQRIASVISTRVAAPHQPLSSSEDLDTIPKTSSTSGREQALLIEHEVAEQCLIALCSPNASGATRQNVLTSLREYAMFSRSLLQESPVTLALAAELATKLSSDDALEALLTIRLTPRLTEKVILTFARNDKFKAVRTMEHRASIAGLLDGPTSKKLWLSFIRAYGILDKPEEAKTAYKTARKTNAWSATDTQPANMLLHALVTDAKAVFIRARQFMDGGMVPDTSTINVLLKACMKSRDAKRAELAWRWMKETGVEPDEMTFACLIKAFSYGGSFEGVISVRNRMEDYNFTPTPRIWGSLLVACGAAQHFETALQLWREYKSANKHAPLPPDAYVAMMVACNACSQGERALVVLAEMKAAGVPPSVTVYNLAIKACESGPGRRPRQEQLWAALGLLSEMQMDLGIVPDAITFGTLMELCAEARQGRVAQQLYMQMQQMKIPANTVVLTSLIKALGRAGMVDECMDVFKGMIWGPSSKKPNRETFRTVIGVLREAGALSHALKVYEGMRKARHAPSNKEFQELIAVAAEVALTQGDPQLQKQVASLCNVNSMKELDLHGMSSFESRAAVLCMLGMLLNQYQSGIVPNHGLTVITGRGGRSRNGESVLKGTILRLMKTELGIPVQETSSTPTTSLSATVVIGDGTASDSEDEGSGSEKNPGRLHVSREGLVKWLEARSAARSRSAVAAAAASVEVVKDDGATEGQ